MPALQQDKTPSWHGIIFPQILADSDKRDFRVLIQSYPRAMPPLLGHTDPFKYKENKPWRNEIYLCGLPSNNCVKIWNQ